MNVRIGGLTPVVGFDKYTVTSAATLDGSLSINLVNGYLPNIGDTFEIMTFASRNGTFLAVNGIDIGSINRIPERKALGI